MKKDLIEKIDKIVERSNLLSGRKTLKESPTIKITDYSENESRLFFYLRDKSDDTIDAFADAVVNWARRNRIISIEDTKFNEDYDINVPGFDNTKNKFFTLASIEIKNDYLKDFIKWLRSDGSIYLKK